MHPHSPPCNTIPVSGRWFTAMSHYPRFLGGYVKYVVLVALLCSFSESAFACRDIPVDGLIGDYYKGAKGEAGPFGCPMHTLGVAHGKYIEFRNGSIVYSPEVWPHSVQGAYVSGNMVHLSWTDTSPFSYDFFIVRWDLDDGPHCSQADIKPGGTNGSFVFHVEAKGWYRIVIEGCDDGFWGAKCRQGWTIPLHVYVRTDDYSGTPNGGCGGGGGGYYCPPDKPDCIFSPRPPTIPPLSPQSAPPLPKVSHHRLQLKHGGQYLDAKQCGSTISLNPGSDWEGGACQLWRFVPVDGEWGRLQLKHGGQYLDAKQCGSTISLNPGSDWEGGACQLWRFVPVQ